MLRLMVLSLPLVALGLGPATARTSCDTYGRCFDFVGANDRLDGAAGEQLWQRGDLAAPVEAIPVAEAAAAQAPATPAAPELSDASGSLLGDPLALAHGTMGDPLEALASDD